MKELSVGANFAWQIAAGEAATSKHQFIEKEHVLIGICSLEKVTRVDGQEESPRAKARQAMKVVSRKSAKSYVSCCHLLFIIG